MAADLIFSSVHNNWTPSLTVVLKIGNKFDVKTRLGRLIYMHTNQILYKKSNGTTICVIVEMLFSVICYKTCDKSSKTNYKSSKT